MKSSIQRCPKELRGAARHRWFDQHKPEIIQSVQQEGIAITCDDLDIGYLALLKNLHKWGLPKGFGFAPVSPLQEPIRRVREQISTFQTKNTQIRLELDERLVNAGISVSIRLIGQAANS